MSFNGETVWRSQTKKFKNSTPPKQNKKNHNTPRAKTEYEPGSHDEIKWSKIEKKTFGTELFKICKNRTKKSRPHLFNFM